MQELPHEQDVLPYETRKYQEKLKTLWNNSVVANLPHKMKTLSILARNSSKIEIEFFPQWTVSHENQILPQIFCP